MTDRIPTRFLQAAIIKAGMRAGGLTPDGESLLIGDGENPPIAVDIDLLTTHEAVEEACRNAGMSPSRRQSVPGTAQGHCEEIVNIEMSRREEADSGYFGVSSPRVSADYYHGDT